MPKKKYNNYDNTLFGRYIRQIENPDSIGWDSSSRIWRQSTRKGDDERNRGMGIDVLNNKAAKKLTQDRVGGFLTEEEERQLRNEYLQEMLNVIDRQKAKHPGLNNMSPRKQAEVIGALYRGDAPKLWDKSTILGKALESPNEEDFHRAIDTYYNSVGLGERARNNDKFWSNQTHSNQSPHVPSPTITRQIDGMVFPTMPSSQPTITKQDVIGAAMLGPKAVAAGVGTVANYINQAVQKYIKPKDNSKDNTVRWAEGGFLKPKDAWDALSMKDKTDMIGIAVKHGITTLSDIRDKYNEFAEGGDTDTDWSYNSWKKQIAEYMGIQPDEDITYDYEAYFKKYPEEAWRMLKGDPDAHFSDEFKTVYHPTFSSKSIGNDGSIYSGVKNPKTNPQGLVGGTWSPDYHTFTMSPDGYRGPVNMDDRKWYLENAEDNGVQLREADGSLPIYDGIPWGGVLPNVTIYGSKHSLGGPLVEAAMNKYKSGGKIHIKPENRGKFTRLKERTGHSATWFKEHGTPAQKKMATFALNARHWKHGLGGNLFYPGGEITYGQPYYSYDENGQLIKDEIGNPILNYNATLPELEIIGTNRNYPLKAKQERARQREIAKSYFASTPTPSNIYKGIEALVNSSPLVTTAATVNPNMVYGIAPTDAAFAGNPLNSTTSNLLKWLGRPTNYRPKNPLSTAPFEKLSYEIKEGSQELKYPGLAKMMDLWERKGVDLSKIGIEDLDDIYRLRRANYTKEAPPRYTIANQTGTNYELIDYDNGMPVGKTDLLIDDSNNLFMSNIRNLTNKYPNGDPRKVHDVQRRGLNSAIAVAKSEGKEGVISGNYLQSAPKQYSAIFEHPERTIVSTRGLHTNQNMVPPGEYGMFGGWEGPAEASSVEEMWANGDKKAMQLQNAPVWKLTEQSFFTPTKSDVFDPTIIDEAGKMHTDWNLLDIFKGLSIPIIGFNAIKNQKEKKNERM